MDAELACGRCWRLFSSSQLERSPRLLDCGHSICKACAGQVLSQNPRNGVTCFTCGRPHAVQASANLTAIPQNNSLLESLRRLQLNPAGGGLLSPEHVTITSQHIGAARNPAVFVSRLKTREQDVQVAVKKLQTFQVPPANFTLFVQWLESLAFATRSCCKLCPLLGFTVLDGSICQVFPLYQQSLQQLLSTGVVLSLAEAAGLTLQIAQGLQQLHSRNIVHGSLKPSNVLLDALRSDAVLSDFAVHSELDRLPNMPACKPFLLYMAPELMDDEATTPPGPPCDVWSLAAIMLHCMTGRPPHDGSTSVRLAVMQGTAPYAVPANLPQALQTLLTQSFEIEPARRPNVRAIQQVLETVLVSAGDAMWSPSTRQLNMSQHPTVDLLALMGAQPAKTGSAAAVQVTQQQQAGPQVDVLLQRSIQAAQQAAQQQVSCVNAYIAELSKALARPKATVPQDLQPLDPHSAVYRELSSLMASADAPVIRISRVNLPEREARFHAWKASLPPHLQTVSRLFHGTNPPTNAQSIARRGPDFSLIGSKNGHVYGRGFYTTSFIDTAVSYAGTNGAICVCAAALGNIKDGGRSDDTAGSLLKQNYHSVVAAGKRITVLFHPDATHVQYIINDLADPKAEKALAAQQAQLDLAWQHKDLVRQKDLQEQQGRLAAIRHFSEVCAAFLAAKAQDKAGLDLMDKHYKLEASEFQQALPIYAHKSELLKMLNSSQCIVLKGAAGSGKSVSIPQWLYDAGDHSRKVAVLVSQAATAEGLAHHISRLRRCSVGQEVGLGIASKVEMSVSSRIIFMTYSFFNAISANAKDLSAWSAVVLDDAHERRAEQDAVLLRLIAACQARQAFQLVIMSAQMDPAVFVGVMHKAKVPTKKLDVPGVLFPIKDVWWCEQSWDPSAAGAVQSLALECVRVYVEEKAGNVLVFVSSTADVNELVQAVRKALAHDSNCGVLGLYADLNEDEQQKVTGFHDLSRFPKNAKKRLICIATDLAESGITIPGVTAVLETGWQTQSVHDPATRSTFLRQTRISKAIQQRRRGLAGRTAPGSCYTVYTQACYDKDFPEHSMPEALRGNLDAFLLGMVSSGLQPAESLQLLSMQQAKSNLESSERHLLKLGAIVKASDSTLKATQLGQVLASLPVNLEFGISIAAAVQHSCSHEVAVIACVATAAGNRVFQPGSHPAQSVFAAKSGDPETYLNVFEAWVQNNRTDAWCNQHKLVTSALQAADGLLQTVLAAMTRCKLKDVSLSCGTRPTERSDAIMQSLTTGFFQQTASSAGRQGQFFITDEYLTNPTRAVLHNMSTLIGTAADSAGMILFFSRSILADGRHLIAGAGQIQPAWVVAAAAFDPKLASIYVATIHATDRKTFHIRISSFPDSASEVVQAAFLAALHSNVNGLVKQHPLAVFDLDSDLRPPILLVTCPATAKPAIYAQLQAEIRALSVSTCTLPYRPSPGSNSDQGSGAVPAAVQQLQQTLHSQAMQIEYQAAASQVVITAFENMLPTIQQSACAILGLGTQPAVQAVPSQPATHGLQVARLMQGGTPADILAKFGKGKAGSLLALGRLVLQHTAMWLYGGFIRDLVLRTDVYDSQDLDVGLPYQGLDAAAGMSSIATLAASIGMQFLRTHPRGDPRVVRGFFQAVDSSVELEVQVVNTQGFPKSVDFDVNNLKLTETKGIEIKYSEGQHREASNLDQIFANISAKQLLVLKPAAQLNARIEKMRSRGWKIMLPQ